jgi:site-specific DNA-methyltransferase (adenine-specific)
MTATVSTAARGLPFTICSPACPKGILGTVEPYYADDLVTLWLGDCREVTGWLKADVLVTDPPYGIGWSSRAGWKNAYGGGTGRRSHPGIDGDRDTSARDDIMARWGNRPGVVFGDLLQPAPAGAVQVLIYAKPDDAGVRGGRSVWRKDAEGIYLTGPWPVTVGGVSSILRTNGRVAGPRCLSLRDGHPHAKPVDVMETLIAACPPGVIADPFAGAGSTLVAARNLGRRAIGVELDERYARLAALRLSQDILLSGPLGGAAVPPPLPLAQDTLF